MVKQELIVARYQENVDWVWDSPFPVTVYNKGSKLDLECPYIDVIDLPNRGREAGTWLDHIVRNYDHLADWSYFVQGEPHQPIPELWKRLAVDYKDTTPLTSVYLENFPRAEVKAMDLVRVIDGLPVHWGLADYFGDREPRSNQAWLKATWLQFFSCPMPRPWWFGYCASYAVPRERIRARPLAYWLWLRELANRNDNATDLTPTSAWGFETVWSYLWGDSKTYTGRAIVNPERPVSQLVIREKGCRKCGGATRPRLDR